MFRCFVLFDRISIVCASMRFITFLKVNSFFCMLLIFPFSTFARQHWWAVQPSFAHTMYSHQIECRLFSHKNWHTHIARNTLNACRAVCVCVYRTHWSASSVRCRIRCCARTRRRILTRRAYNSLKQEMRCISIYTQWSAILGICRKWGKYFDWIIMLALFNDKGRNSDPFFIADHCI